MNQESPRRPPALIEVVQATPQQASILENLLELYCHDFSEFHEMSLGPDGRFGYPNLQLYWTNPGRYPLLVQVDGSPAGLILIKRGSDISGRDDVWDMAEFFVVRGHRRQGIGTEMARQAWTLFPGHWEIRAMDSNPAAANFWQHAIEQFTGDAADPVRLERNGKIWLLFSFESQVTARTPARTVHVMEGR